MGINGELGISSTLVNAFREVLGETPTIASPLVVLAAYLDSLMKEYGLTDSQHLDPDKLELPPLADAAREFIEHFLGGSEDADSLRNSLYRVLTPMADNADIRQRINKSNKLSDSEVLLLGQIAWNLEHNAQRPRLPLKPRQIRRDGKPSTLDIPVPKQDMDFATMRWTKRRNLSGVPGKSTGASFASQAARLAVLAAKWLLESSAQPVPDVGEACLLDGGKGTKRVVWDTDSDQELAPARTGLLPANYKAQGHKGRVFVGDFAEVGDRYQRRGIDSEIARLWGDGGDRRVWLRGGPGLGKSYTARKVMQEALSGVDDDRHDLLIWVNSADSVAVTREFSRAAERLSRLGDSVPADAADRDSQLARALLDHLRTTDTRWLIVLDDADAEGLIENKLVPTGVNPRGRVLITTLSNSHRIDGVGRHVEAELFSRAEAEEFLKNRLPETSQDSRVRLTQTLRQHPLALSIAASTIAANSMAVSAWIEEFDHASRMDEAADYSDVGGYPRLIGTTWQLALDRASQGMPNGVVERAAMIAALQKPDGHPTWLWQRDDVREWVASGSDFPNRGRMHPGIKRLVDYGIIRLIGGWQDGRLAIHQLAARAIRESAAPETLAELGALLADQWLLEITPNPANTQSKDVWAAIGPIAALPNLKLTARNTVTALLGFSQPSTSEQVLGWERDELELMRPHLSRGGAIGLADLARRLVGIGLGDRGLGRPGHADKHLTEAVGIYERLTEIPDLSDDLRAAYLESLADLDTELNRPGLAFERRTNAAKLRERFQVSNAREDKLISNQLALVDLYQELSDQQRTEAALDRALSIGAGQVPADAEADALAQAGLGRRLVSVGRTEEAEKYLRRAAELYETTELGRIVYFRGIATELGYICARAGKWSEAEDWFTRSEREPVLLASVLLHQGRRDDARATLARAANHAEAVAQPNPLVDARIREDIEDSLLPMLYSLVRKAINRERVQDAADLMHVCLELTRAREDLSPGDNPMELADAYFRAAITSRSAERHDTAVSFFTSYANILEMLVQITPSDELQSKYGQSLYWLAATTQEAGDQEHAAIHARRAVEILSQLDSEESRGFLNLSLSVLGRACMQIGAADEAIASFTRQVDVWQQELERNPDAGGARRPLADAYKHLGQALAMMPEMRDDAVPPLTAAIDLYLLLCRDRPDDDEVHTEAANAHFLLACVHYRRDSPAESVPFAERSAVAWQELIDVDPSNAELQVKLAHTLIFLSNSLTKIGRGPEAVDALARAANHFQLPTELQPSKHKLRFMQLLDGLERGLRELGRIDQANKVRARANDFDRRYPLPADEG